MATLLHIDVHEDDTKGVGNMSPNVSCLQEDLYEAYSLLLKSMIGAQNMELEGLVILLHRMQTLIMCWIS